jgi:hypothetical protein
MAGKGVMLARRTHVHAAPKWYTVMPKPHLSYPHVAIDLDKEKLTSISTDARGGRRWPIGQMAVFRDFPARRRGH